MAPQTGRSTAITTADRRWYFDLHSHSTDASDDAGGTVEGYAKWIVARRKRGFHIDGFVLTRSAFHHSVNYRSVVVLGRPEEVTDAAERAARMRIFMEGLFPGRWDTLRPVKPKEIKATRLLRLRIDEASAKIRSGPPADDTADFTWPAWGGIIPVAVHAGTPLPDEHVKGQPLSPPKPAKFR